MESRSPFPPTEVNSSRVGSERGWLDTERGIHIQQPTTGETDAPTSSRLSVSLAPFSACPCSFPKTPRHPRHAPPHTPPSTPCLYPSSILCPSGGSDIVQQRKEVSAGCPVVCECPAGPPSCPPGVSSVPDACGCCKVCAAQLNQDCHDSRPCDHHKGLECNYGNDVGHTHGICRAKLEGRSCEYNGRIYQNGANFRAGCKHQCTCIDGAVGCVPLCPSHVPLVTPSCPAPRLVKVPGQCCLSIDCKGSSVVPPVHRHPQPPAYPPFPFMPYPAYKPYPKPYPKLYHYKPKDTMGNELVEVEKKWDKHLASWRQFGGQCVVQTTSWSQCSRSCGMAVSSRVTNDNAQCKLVKETRLCNIRPCSSISIPIKKGRKCSRTHKAPEPLRLSYAGCRSTRLYRPNYCGVCVDGRCCSPRRTRTASVTFACPDGEHFDRSVMFVQSCKCGDKCSHLNEASLPPQQWLYGDTHKFTD